MTLSLRSPAIGIGFALVSAIGFGLNPPLTAFLNQHGVVPVESVFLRCAILLAVTAVVMIATRRDIRIARVHWGPFAGITLATISMSLCYLSSVAFIPVGLSVTILYTFPLVVLLLSPAFEGTRINSTRLGLALLAFCGVVVAIGPSLGALDWRGVALAIGAVCSATTIFLCARRLAGVIDGITSVFLIHLIGLPVLGAVAYGFGRGAGWLDPSLSTAAATSTPLAAVGIGFSALIMGLLYVCGYLGMFNVVRHAPVSHLTLFYNIEPVVTIAAAAVLVGERLSANQYAGAVLVLSALVASGMVARQSNETPQEAV